MMRMPRHQRGLTLVELLVAVSLSVLVALAAVAALVVSRRGFTSVDAASELRDNARFASAMLQRISAQAGFLDKEYATQTRRTATDGTTDVDLADPPPDIQGFNNALIADANVGNPLATAANESRTAACNAADGGGCSDILVVRYQSQSLFRSAGAASVPSDLSMIDCSGDPLAEGPLNRDDKGISIFYVGVHRGEPALMCIAGFQRVVAGVLSTTWKTPVPIVQSVENFQVLYGTDGVTPAQAPASGTGDSVPDRYLRANQLTVAGNTVATDQNWRRVRSLRIGMILRGPTGSQQEQNNTDPLFPFGAARSASGADAGSFFVPQTADDDKGTRYTPPNDRRLRHNSTFTVYLHNDQGLCMGDTCAVQAP